ncbi:hypothetical protein [Hymenobacter terrenus]|uniref:hypothetical protein n=1 Tax=Hymenobacter terrenus TaxID=1629124 RepID=UPI0006197ADE|nr:hypothetical protein [Hymenobacter terrenus]
MPALFHNLADAADYLSEAPGIMDSFGDFSSKSTPWFYSLNPHLAGGVGRPKQFSSWEHWHRFSMNQKLYLCRQAGLKSNAIAENSDTLNELREAWAAWPAGYYVVNWATTTEHGSTCNIFLGECLTLCGYEHQAQHGGKYLSAQSYWQNHNRGFVHEVAKRPGNIKRGMIMSYNYGAGTFHLEVITSGAVGEPHLWGLYSSPEKTTFKSRGGGRGNDTFGFTQDGVERQGGLGRSLSDSQLKIFRLNH